VRVSCAFWLIVGLILPATVAWAMFGTPPRGVPLERLTRNARAYITRNRKSPKGFYVLARIYSMAYAQGADAIDDFYLGEKGELPEFAGRGYHLPYREEPCWIKKYFAALPAGALIRDVPGQLSKIESAKLNRLVQECDAPGWQARDRATKPLFLMGPRIIASLKALLQGKGLSLEQRIRIKWVHRRLSVVRYLHLAANAYEQARKLAPKDGKILLGLAWAHEMAGKTPRALALYRACYRLSLPKETKVKLRYWLPGTWHGSFAWEAGERILALTQKQQGQKISEERQQITAALATLKKNRRPNRRAMTPIILPLGPDTRYASLVSPKQIVRFDLEGGGTRRRWTWVSSNAGILVWDPTGKGKITSGRQMFGSTTWWIFWNHGYEALAMLDDDRNGWLEKRELRNLAIWQDRDQDGISDAGEVRALRRLGIVRIRVHATGRSGAILEARPGVVFADGRTVPTYDWISREVSDRGGAADRR